MNLLDYQKEPVKIIREGIKTRNRILIVMATGLGKTVIAGNITNDLLPLGRGLFLCHDNYILEQNMNVFSRSLGQTVSFGLFHGDKKVFKKVDILFASFQTMRDWKTVFYEDEFDWIIVDEGHHGMADTFFETLNYFKPKIMIGMTATPFREDGKDIRSIFGEPIVDIPLEEAIAKGWLTKVEYHVMNNALNTNMLKKMILEEFHEKKRVSYKQLNSTIFIQNRDEEIVKKIKSFGDKKTIIFCNSISAIYNIKKYFPNAQMRHSKQSKKLNHQAYEDFNSGACRMIIVVDQFNEGIDVPDVDMVVFLRPTDSSRIFIQQLGRALRKIFNKEKVIVLDFVANTERLLAVNRMAKRIRDYVEHEPYDRDLINLSGENFSFDFEDGLIDLLEFLKKLKEYQEFRLNNYGIAFTI